MNFRWLTPEEFNTTFGSADQDIQTLTNWLGPHGFSGVMVSKGRTVIAFDGSAGQFQNAFHTAIHRYNVSGQLHFANASDPSIPTALVPIVAGLISLHSNF